MPMASDALSPAAVHNSPQFVKAVAGDMSHGLARRSPHSMVRGAMRMAARSGSSAGSASAIWRARSQLSRAAAMSRLVAHVAGAHVPAVGGVQITGGLQMLGDQRRVLVGRVRVALFDRGGQPPMQLGAIGFELGFVGHRADQRVVEHILGPRGEPDLIDQLGRRPSRRRRDQCPARSAAQGRTASRSPPRRSACAWPSGRAGRCARRWSPATWRARSPRQPLPSTRVGAAAARAARRARPVRARSPRRRTDYRRPSRRSRRPSAPTEGSGPSSSATSAAVSESLSGARAIV